MHKQNAVSFSQWKKSRLVTIAAKHPSHSMDAVGVFCHPLRGFRASVRMTRAVLRRKSSHCCAENSSSVPALFKMPSVTRLNAAHTLKIHSDASSRRELHFPSSDNLFCRTTLRLFSRHSCENRTSS